MEFIDGVDLEHYLMGHRDAGYPVLLSIMRDIAYAMEYIHSQNVLHLDLRCANIMVRIWNSFYSILLV